ncbi:MAG: signal peptidase II [candidate division NC10 bacterium]|nr:signal peptidase II [candidate division NC10 bacterium]
MTKRLELAVLVIAALGCIGCDQATKSLATAVLRGEAPRVFLSGALEVRYAENIGGFLSLGASLPAHVRYFAFVLAATVALLGLVVLIFRDASLALPQLLAVACVFGGGVGNLIDRLAFGYVRDFTVLHIGPLRTGIFNLADVAVTLGSVALVLLSRRGGRSSNTPLNPTARSARGPDGE